MGHTLNDAMVRVEEAFNGIEAPKDTERPSKEQVERRGVSNMEQLREVE
jgi:hypothetical protein